MWKDKLHMRYLPLDDEESVIALSRIHARMEDEGTLAAALIGERDRSREGFLSIMLRNGTLPYIMYWEGKEAGLAWAKAFGEKSCLGNCCLYKEYWGSKSTAYSLPRGVFTKVLTYRDGDGYLFDLVVNLAAVSNPLSWCGAIRAGARKVGVIPNGLFCADKNESVDAVLTVVTREILGVGEE